MSVAGIEAVAVALQAIGIGAASAAGSTPASPAAAPADRQGFADMLLGGVERLDVTSSQAEDMVRRFSLGGDLPPHQVMLALEEARLTMQFALQVRSRLVEGYQELMRMQM